MGLDSGYYSDYNHVIGGVTMDVYQKGYYTLFIAIFNNIAQHFKFLPKEV